MPAIGNLNGFGCRSVCRLAIPAAAITRDNADLGMAGQPCLNRAGLTIGEKVDDASPFEIADNAAVALAALPGPIIDADEAQRRAVAGARRAAGCPCLRGTSAVVPVSPRVGHLKQCRGGGRRGPATQSNVAVADDCFEQEDAPHGSGGYPLAKRLREDARRQSA